MLKTLEDFQKESFFDQGALYAWRDHVWLFWGEITKSKRRPETPSILVADFFLEKEMQWWSFSSWIKLPIKELKGFFCSFSIEYQWEEASQDHFQKQFQKIQEWFTEKKANKVVPYVFEKSCVTLSAQEKESLIGHGLSNNQGFLYGAWEAGEGLLGLSPELLISQSGKEMKTMALAGTCAKEKFNESPSAFMNDAKELREHSLVVADLKKQLTRFKELKFYPMEIEKTPTLVHLKTEVEFITEDERGLEEVVQILHPTPALGCSPRDASLEIMGLLNEWEPRGRFGAPFGFSESLQQAQVIVAIRNLIWDKETVKIGSGCGIVKESQINKEWEELKNKRSSVKKVFGLI